MKLLVLGHSDSDGSRLEDPARAWPTLVSRRLESAAGVTVEVTHRLLYPTPSAESFVRKQLEMLEPDAVVLATTTHSVVVKLISNHVREQWGERAAARAERAERWAARKTASAPDSLKPFMVSARKMARRLVGARPAMTLEQLIGIYADCMAQLARREQLHTVIGGGIGYIGEIKRLNPGIEERQASAQQRFRALAASHHFDWLSHEAVLGGPGLKDQYYQADGMHTGGRSHELFADALYPLLLKRL